MFSALCCLRGGSKSRKTSKPTLKYSTKETSWQARVIKRRGQKVKSKSTFSASRRRLRSIRARTRVSTSRPLRRMKSRGSSNVSTPDDRVAYPPQIVVLPRKFLDKHKLGCFHPQCFQLSVAYGGGSKSRKTSKPTLKYSTKEASIMASAAWHTSRPKNRVTRGFIPKLGSLWCAIKVTGSL